MATTRSMLCVPRRGPSGLGAGLIGGQAARRLQKLSTMRQNLGFHPNVCVAVSSCNPALDTCLGIATL